MSGSVLEKKTVINVAKKDEFESYLQTRRENTTYNGIELEDSDWDKKLFGFKMSK